MRQALVLAAFAGTLLGQTIPPGEYQTRRAVLQKTLDGVLVMFGGSESEDLHSGFFQETNFLYLSGWREPGSALMLTAKEEIFFLPPRSERGEIFTGRKLGADDADATQKTGFARVLPLSALQSVVAKALEVSPRLYTFTADTEARKLFPLALFQEKADASRLLIPLRMVKSQAELALIQKATDASIAAHFVAWKTIKPGLFEYEVAAAMTNTYFMRGCERSAYAPIVGSGPNSTVLHYSSNHRRMDGGDVVVMDVGAECSDYATDITRTVPANGKFSSRQKEIYEIVLGAQKAAIEAIKPGARLRSTEGASLYQIAYDYINSHGKDLHGQPLGKYFTHGLSHHVGLDVHDLSDNTPLKAGMVITIEPGIYIPEENIGVRIEDTLVVTENGSRNLSAALPREPGEIEKLLSK